MTVCWTHGGARKKNRWGESAANFRHGERSLEVIAEARHARERVRALALGVAALNGSEAAAKAFEAAWPELLEQQQKEHLALQKRIGRRRK